MNTTTPAITVPFYNTNLALVEHNGQPYTPMKPIVEGMGLAWKPQFVKLQDGAERFGVTIMVIPVSGAVSKQEAICMPLRKLPGWLMSISPNKVRDTAVRERVIQYQNECDDVLWDYWTKGQAVNPRHGDLVQEDTLLPSEQQTLSEVAHNKAAPYGETMGKALAEIWSRLHRKFRIAKYSQLPRTQLTDAILYITGMELRLPRPPERVPLTKEQKKALRHGIDAALFGPFLKTESCNHWVHNRLRTEFHIRNLDELPPARLPEALALLDDLGQKANAFTDFVCQMREAYCREVIGGGQVWTPWVTRQLGGVKLLPSNPDWNALGRAIQQRLTA